MQARILVFLQEVKRGSFKFFVIFPKRKKCAPLYGIFEKLHLKISPISAIIIMYLFTTAPAQRSGRTIERNDPYGY